MIEQLNTARTFLSFALDRYLDACISIQRCHEKTSFVNLSPELSSHVASEVHVVTELEAKLRTARVAICWSRNCSPSLVPIHKLPSELLARIFLLVTDLQPESDWGGNPEVLSHVCSRWRKVALGFPLLWRSISLPFSELLEPHVHRAVSFISRAHPSHLDIRLRPDSYPSKLIHLKPQVIPIGTIAIRSLEVASVTAKDLIQYFQGSVLDAYFTQCEGGTLKSFTIYHINNVPIYFDVTDDLPEYLHGYDILATGNLDQVLAPPTILRTKGVYPIWTSKAYHGLVELRLIRTGKYREGDSVLISEDHLRGILTASPALQILEFSLRILECENASVTPVPLDHLESLNIVDIPFDQLEIFLRLLAPGSKPLHLAMDMTDNESLRPQTEFRSFFARSIVTKLYARILYGPYLLSLIKLCPHLKTLVWNAFKMPFLNDPIPAIPHNHLETLVISRSKLDHPALLEIISQSDSLQNLSFWDCKHQPGNKPICVDDFKHISDFRPVVRILDNDPTRHWGIYSHIPRCDMFER